MDIDREGVLISGVRQSADIESALNYCYPLNIHVKRLPSLEHNRSSPPHNGSRGVDLDISFDSELVFVDTYTRGSVDIFVLFDFGELKSVLIDQRFSIPLDSYPVFIRNTCLSKFPRSCSGCIVAFRLKIGRKWSDCYKFGVVESVRYLQCDCSVGENTINLWEYTGSCGGGNHIPSILLCQDWDSLFPLVVEKKINLDNIKFFFLNQVRYYML